MDSLLSQARAHAEKFRFSGDVSHSAVELTDTSETAREKHYQDAVEICAALTPALWKRLLAVCERLYLPSSSLTAFIYSSPHLQAQCLFEVRNHCTLRISSAMLNLLSDVEFEFVVGHEIGHFLLKHQPVRTTQSTPDVFVQMRSQEISADRLGLLACGSLETAMRALIKTVSGLTERHLRFDVSAFIAQLRKIELSTPDWSGSTHPSIVIRAKALLWFSLAGLLGYGKAHVVEEMSLLDKRVERDLQRYVDGAIKKQIEETKTDLLLWMMTYEITQLGTFSKLRQAKVRKMFDDDTVASLLGFLDGLRRSELDEVIHQRVSATRAQLEALIPDTFELELSKIRMKIEQELN
jgi:hypothetical protein